MSARALEAAIAPKTTALEKIAVAIKSLRITLLLRPSFAAPTRAATGKFQRRRDNLSSTRHLFIRLTDGNQVSA
jgi:hypothetical protein